MSDLLIRISGNKLYSSSHLPKKVVLESASISSYLLSNPSQLCIHFIDKVAIYEPASPEVLYFDDAVGVKRQNEIRRVPWAEGSKSSATVQTDVIVIGNEQSGFHYLSSAEAENRGLSLEDLVRVRLSEYYGGFSLPIVAITDGARTIRLRLWSLFGLGVMIILDWYHLQKKVWQYLSRLGLDKESKGIHGNALCSLLWKGDVLDGLTYLEKRIDTKKQEILNEFCAYLEKHKAEICNYEQRQAAGKTIGSGRGEKANDQLVANRQKKKAMSWSKTGSHALTILQTLQINEKWGDYWKKAA